MTEFMIFLVGMLIGCGIAVIYYERKRVGCLRIDSSDPVDGPYFFLELESGKAGYIQNHKEILLTVNTENYISQE